ncbi:histidinol-phosphate transaminase [Clostridium sp. YIM B02515]|uniref:Histidinol-phosphate aminotransferase n=1 Tax=Clostridium rhizosphaerae TaxID=2803861 RepID=A0ABS1TC08_9CLOT|nr:histidinol-phosphate transaminase [Clostridium rhizosphaerae]MBL4936292.1 histidinol-phosphate transaminase [Clostridium rhizosphaerae]
MGYGLRKEVLGLEMYVAGKPISEVKRELGLTEVIKLASNENPLGCSPKVKQALKETIEEASLYPDASNYELKMAIAKNIGVKTSQVFCGTGSDLLIRVICSTLLNPGDESIMAEVTFSRYDAGTKLMGGKSILVPMKDNGLDIDKMVDSITDKTKIIWLCNPNNPTGTIFRKDDLERIIDRIPENVIVIMDEAYIEYVTDKEYPDSIALLDKYPNMIILRTFSKAYGLAGLRCGYGIANENMVKYFNTVAGPFDVNLFAQKAAVAALQDKEYLRTVQDTNKAGKDYLYEEFKKLGLEYIETNANFIMVSSKIDDKILFNELLRKGIIIRPGYLLGMPGWLRVTIGTNKQNEQFVKALKEILDEQLIINN